MKIKTYILILVVFGFIKAKSQSNCSNPVQLCFATNTVITFPSATSTTAQVGPAYGCLASQPNPTWLYFKTNSTITNTVTQFVLSSTNDLDIIIWGPFPSTTSFCSSITNSTSIIGCSYSAAATETVSIPNTQPNQFYLVMVTNYSGIANTASLSCTQGVGNIFCPTSTPVANFTSTTTTSSFCQGQAISFSDMSSPIGSITSWSYTCAGATPSVSTLQNPAFTFNTTGVYTLSLTVNSSSGSSSIAKTITVTPCVTPTATAFIISPTCFGTCNGSATVTASGGAPFTYSWVPSGGTNNVAFGLCPGSYNCIVTNSLNNSTIQTVNIVSPPSINIFSTKSPSVVCAGNTSTISLNFSGGTPPYIPTWSNGLNGAPIVVTPTVVPSTSYTVNVTDANGCVKTSVVSVSVNPIPSVSVTPVNPTICAGKTSTINLSGALNYTSNPGGITLSSYTVNPVTTTIYSVTGISSQGCVGNATGVVTVVVPPNILSTVNTNTLCVGSTVTFSNSGGATYTLVPSSLTGSVINFTPTVTGVTIYTVIGTSPVGCINTKTLSITAFSVPNTLVSPSNADVCSGKSVTLNATGANTYSWSTGLTSSSISLFPTSSGTYTVLGINTSGCSKSAVATISLITTPTISINTPSTNVCFGYTMTVGATGSNNYLWYNGATTNTIILQPFTSTTYSVIGGNGGGCTDTAYLAINVLPLPSVSASVNTTSACVGQTINLTATGSSVNYLWQPGSLFGANHSVIINSPTTYTVYGQGTNGCAYFNTIFVNVSSIASVTPVITPSIICSGSSAILSIIGGTIPQWSSNVVPNTSIVSPSVSTTFYANALDNNGCSSNVSFYLNVDEGCALKTYSGFSPNDDGINDNLIIGNIENYSGNNVSIYNRWENKVFETTNYNNYNNYWNGKLNGTTLPSGTYFYLINLNDGSVPIKGWVELTGQ